MCTHGKSNIFLATDQRLTAEAAQDMLGLGGISLRPARATCGQEIDCTAKFLWTERGPHGEQREEVLARVRNIIRRKQVPVPNNWFPKLRFAELPGLANRSVDKVTTRQRLDSVQCICVDIVKPISAAAGYSGLFPGMMA